MLRRGQLLTSRDTGVLAAIGVAAVDVWRKPIVAILSTGDEIIAPGEPMQPAKVYDSNAQVLADAVRELGGEPKRLGITHDDMAALRERASARARVCRRRAALRRHEQGRGRSVVSRGRRTARSRHRGHGVALKPGKPICLAATRGRPVVVLPGFPTSAIFTFHEFVAPVLRLLAGRGVAGANRRAGPTGGQGQQRDRPHGVPAGRTGRDGGRRRTGTSLAAYPMGQGSGSVTTFSRADGFATIGRHEEIVQAGTLVDVQLLGRDLQLADLVVIGSHCIGLDYLLGELQQQGVRSKFLAVGSTAGLDAAKRGECDLAGIHLLDPKTDQYNRPFLTPALELVAGYGRAQGVVFRRGDARFEGRTAQRRDRRRQTGSDVRDGQPQPGQRHTSADRSPARGRQAARAMPCNREITTPWPPPSRKAARTGE